MKVWNFSLSEKKYTRNMIKKFGIDKAKAKRTPTTSHLKVSKDDSGDKIYESLYRSIIRSPLYLTASRHDIAYVVGVCVRYQFDLRASHLHCAKRILKYILGIVEYGLWYSFDKTPVLVG